MNSLDEILENACRARLIPTVADSRKEERAVSILLATLSVIRPFAEQILKPCAVRVKKTSKISSYTEVKFPATDGSDGNRPDGILRLSTRNSQWTALLEAKTDNSKISEEQIVRYAETARAYGIDAVITLSNQLVALPAHVPYPISKKFTKSCQFLHLSWTSILTQALLTLKDAENLDPDQVYILREMVRYFEHSNSGVKRFDQMNPEWRDLIIGIRDGRKFARTTPEIENTIASWHQEERDICLILSRCVGEHISLRIPRKHQDDPGVRLREASESLVSSQELRSTFVVPRAASNLDVAVNLQRRTISCSMELDAPGHRAKASGRINWLVRQLKNIEGDDVIIRAFWPRGRIPTQATLSDIRANPKCLENGKAGAVPARFEIIVNKYLAGRFSKRRNFIEDIEKLVPEFYERIGQHLRPWISPPPAIGKQASARNIRVAESVAKPGSGDLSQPRTTLSKNPHGSDGWQLDSEENGNKD